MSSRVLIMRVVRAIGRRWPGFAYRAATVVAWLGWNLRPDIRRRVVRNMLPLCDGDLAVAKRMGQRAYRHVCDYYVDLSTMPRRDIATFEAGHLEIFHGERLGPLRDDGAIVLVSAHTGNAELAVQALTSRGRRFVALVEAQEPPGWSRYLLDLRSSTGGAFYEANFSGVRACVAALKQGQVVAMMADRDIQHVGMCTTFFGRCVRLPRGPWELARRMDALVLPVFATRKHGDQFRIDVEETFRVGRDGDAEQDIREAVERYVALLERHLRRDPSQWAVLEDFWKEHACGTC